MPDEEKNGKSDDKNTKKDKKKSSPAVQTARAQQGGGNTVTLSTGVQARLVPVATALIEDAQSRVEEPQPPVVFIKEKEREEANYNDPDYRRAVEQARRKRGMAVIDTIIMFGVELVDGVPDDDGWLGKLKFLEKQGHISLDGYDLDDDMEREFLYKKNVAVAAEDYDRLLEICGVTPRGIQAQADKFRGDEG